MLKKLLGKILGRKEQLNPKAFGTALAGITLIIDLVGYILHGILNQPSVINLLYPGFWGNYSLILLWFAGSVVSAYIIGCLFAYIYNSVNKK